MRFSGLGLAALLALGMAGDAFAQQSTQGYIRRDGTYVAPSYRTTPNSTRLDNYSTRGNSNPFTGQRGSVSPVPTYRVPATRAPAPYRAPSTRR
jgi:hypothetical protein